jgi:hypothetical protein
MDVELWERLEHHAPLQRRSVTNLLQKLVADGLDRLDEEEAAREVRRGKPPHVIGPPPPKGMTRRRKRKPT